MPLLPVSLQRGSAEVYRRSGLAIAHEESMRDSARRAVLVLFTTDGLDGVWLLPTAGAAAVNVNVRSLPELYM